MSPEKKNPSEESRQETIAEAFERAGGLAASGSEIPRWDEYTEKIQDAARADAESEAAESELEAQRHEEARRAQDERDERFPDA
jgi:hypothetical protein